ncbi:MAG: transposase [Acidobacteriales bacterium]|nr:transposase [Terriglobales bacterium]
MKLTLRQQLTQFAHVLQSQLFPAVEESIGELDDTARRLVAVLEMIPLGRFVPASRGWIGRPSKDRLAIACAFVAKAVYGFNLTRQLLERLHEDPQLRRICGWKHARQVPHESTFSRAFAEFAAMELPQFVHEALIASTQKDRLIGHIARDSTAIEARERFPESVPKSSATPQPASTGSGKKGRPKGKRGPHRRHKGGKPPARRPKENTRLHRQRKMRLPAMLAELPRHCSLGVKTKEGGNQQYWRGYKLHLDVADGQIPISAILTAASLHDSQVAIPLATMTAQRVTSLYDVMDAAYDATEIYEHSRSLGHVPIIKPVRRQQKETPFSGREKWEAREMTWAEQDRFRERTMVERVNARLKDEFGGRQIRVRGASKIMAHLMFGVLVLTADQILKLVS